LTTRVRIQFSRDLNKDTIAGHVSVSYATPDAVERGEASPPAVTVTATYLEGLRVLELRFPDGLARFRVVRVSLTSDILATDGAALVPYTLSFTLGG